MAQLQVFVWSELFETGVELIDSQHKVLVDLTNRLADAVMNGDDPQESLAVLERLKEYATLHFSAEEAWSVQAGQPPQALTAHHATHGGFLAQVLRFAEGWDGGKTQAQALHRFLSAWLITHILGDDRTMVLRLSQQAGSPLASPSVLGVGEKVMLEAFHNLYDAMSGMAQDLERQVQVRTEELAQSNQRLKRNFLTGIRTFTSLMELRGGMLAGHSRRVADLARKLAVLLKLDGDTVQQVFLGALLHDLGKIGFSDELMGKPVTQMTGHELSLYRSHAVNGEAALIALDDLHAASLVVRHHHERWDGKGYPDGLQAERIPLEARIVAVANDFDGLQHGTITARRLSLDEALSVIQGSRGERYDPRIVDALSTLLGRSGGTGEPEVVTSSAMLKPGMTLTRDLITPEGMLLLAAHNALEANTIVRIRRFLGAGGMSDLKVYVRPETVSGP
ncbi:bacteriohemerythrin [Hydrogenophaga crassostreae]|uniref:bacteriohemerythrin n=1 Tax=Hydrogenophaga crassostreae TaxID=1763535 RepID=UPI0009EEE98E|nr:bacteriohemerythrin [Hydrogenophaga crassostreae]